MKKVKLSDITEYVRNGKSIKNSSDGSGLPITRIETISDGTFNEDKLGYGGVKDLDKVGDYWLQDGDILMSHINSPKHLGKAALYKKNDLDIIHGMNLLGIRPQESEVLSEYLHYYFLSNDFDSFIKSISNQSVNQASFAASKLKKLEIPLPSLSEQKAIVAKLDRAQRLIDIDKEMLAKYDELIQSVFLEMFGDPVRNPKGWEVGSITDYGSLKNGLNYSSNESGTQIRSLGVGDFGVLSKIDNVRAISRIELDEAPPENYMLKDNDLVFVRSNGNKELVGRCLVIYPGNEDVTFSGFCIRYRPNSSSINSTYLSHLFRVKSFRNYMLKDGRGANIQNINQKLLSQLDIPLPDISKQNQFAKNVEKLEGQILKTQTSLKKSEELFSSLVQGVFET